MANSTGHQSPQSTLPPFALKTVNTRVWQTTGTTDTVTDEYVHPNSIIVINNTSAYVGPWSIAVSQGSFTITSGNSETQTTTTYSYIVL
jgi:hypothetical protein